jgi:hypothetical protein
MVGPPFSFALKGGFSISARGRIMGTTEIVVIVCVALVMGAMGALVWYSNRPVKEEPKQVAKQEPKKQ